MNIIKQGVRNYDSVAIELGATHTRRYFTTYIESNIWSISGRRVTRTFSTHYFNEQDVEIGYTVEDMIDLCGMVVFDTPRVWSDEFKLNENYGKPVSLKHCCVTNMGYVGEKKMGLD